MTSTAPAATPSASSIPAAYAAPRLLADVGGTNARFALETARGRFEQIEVLACADYATLADALRAYLALPEVAARLGGAVRHGAIAIANPITSDQVRMTNHHWSFSIEGLGRECGFEQLVVVNDFTALARALPFLAEDEKRQVGHGQPVAGSPIGLLGPGTGLGVSGLIPAGAGWTALLSEGGHATFAPADARENAILQYAWREHAHVSAERLLCGDGLELIFRALVHIDGRDDAPLKAAEITGRALAGDCGLCGEVVDIFCGMLGTMAGNLALTLGSQGGVFVGGGIVPRLGERFDRSPFRARFEAKGRFQAYLSAIPTYVITARYPAFVGVAAVLAERLDAPA
jgi:glucokinase